MTIRHMHFWHLCATILHGRQFLDVDRSLFFCLNRLILQFLQRTLLYSLQKYIMYLLVLIFEKIFYAELQRQEKKIDIEPNRYRRFC